jgi:hypothetical protein
MLPGRFVSQLAVPVEPLRGLADHHFRLTDDRHVEGDEYLAQMVLRAGRAQTVEAGLKLTSKQGEFRSKTDRGVQPILQDF